MRTIWLVARHEFCNTLRKRSFWLLSVLLPILLVGANLFGLSQDPEFAPPSPDDEPPPLPHVALVDASGLMGSIPAELPPDLFQPYPGEAEARAALAAGEVDQVVIIPADYLSSGRVDLIAERFQLFSQSSAGLAGAAHGGLLDYLLAYNLAGDAGLAAAVLDPLPAGQVEAVVLAPAAEQRDAESQLTAILVAQFMPLIFYMILLTGSGFLLQSVTAEKENRTAEVLLLSVNPRQLMLGKVLGLGLAALIQLSFWLLGGYLAFGRGLAAMQMSAFTFSPALIVWILLYLAFGYLLYGAITAAAGAIAPNAREGAAINWLLILPLLPTLLFSTQILEEPNGPLAVGLSLFPFSAPGAMVTRLALTDVPAWQLLLSLVGLIATAYLFVALAARFFRPENLLSDARFSWRRLAAGWHT
ncbi:MAG: ABC transporter permease [Candidatus Promineifilaceae bacterium]